MSARFKAGAMGLPFLPTRGPLGSDIVKASRTKVIDCPFTGRQIALLPASNPNVAIIHVQAADKYGNCIIRGTDCTCAEIAMASAHTIVTCEQLVSHELVASNPKEVLIPFLAVDAIVEVPFGAYPGACRRHYYFNGDHIKEFHAACMAMSKEGKTELMQDYYDENIFGVEDFSDFISRFAVKKLLADQAAESFNCERLA